MVLAHEVKKKMYSNCCTTVDSMLSCLVQIGIIILQLRGAGAQLTPNIE